MKAVCPLEALFCIFNTHENEGPKRAGIQCRKPEKPCKKTKQNKTLPTKNKTKLYPLSISMSKLPIIFQYSVSSTKTIKEVDSLISHKTLDYNLKT